MKISILHLSDIHLRKETNSIFNKKEQIFNAIKNTIYDSNHLFIAITGDIAFSGLSEEYEIASELLLFLKNSLTKYQPECPIDFIIIPGNHDCDFSNESSVRNIVISEIIKDPNKINEEIINTCTEPQKKFFEFSKTFHDKSKLNAKVCNKLMCRFDFEIGEYKIGFNAFNISWTSKKDETQSHLVFPTDSILQLPSTDEANLSISLIHHPFYWLNHQNIQSFKNNLEKVSNIILSGHEHSFSGSKTKKFGGKPKEYIESGVLQNTKSEHESSFSIINFDIKNNIQKVLNYNWDRSDKMYIEKLVNEDIDFLKRNNGLFHLNSEYRKKINTPAIKFVHPNKENLELTDLFIFQNLKKIHDNKTNINLSAQRIVDGTNSLNERICIFGDDSSGKTSLSYIIQLYV